MKCKNNNNCLLFFCFAFAAFEEAGESSPRKNGNNRLQEMYIKPLVVYSIFDSRTKQAFVFTTFLTPGQQKTFTVPLGPLDLQNYHSQASRSSGTTRFGLSVTWRPPKVVPNPPVVIISCFLQLFWNFQILPLVLTSLQGLWE